MLFKKHSTLMSHLLLTEKHELLLLNNVESRPAQEVHTTTAHHPNAVVVDTMVEVHVAETSRRPPKGSYRKTHPSHQAREMRAYGKSDVHKGYHKRDENTSREPHRPRVNQFKPRNHQTHQFQGNCHKCGRKGHFAKDCRAPPCIVNMYKELHNLELKPVKLITLRTPILSQTPPHTLRTLRTT